MIQVAHLVRHGVREAVLAAPVAAAHGHDRHLGDDDGAADGGGHLRCVLPREFVGGREGGLRRGVWSKSRSDFFIAVKYQVVLSAVLSTYGKQCWYTTNTASCVLLWYFSDLGLIFLHEGIAI